MACHVTDRLPRLIGVQARGLPAVEARVGRIRQHSHVAETIADGIAVVKGINAETALRDVRASDGGFVAVSDGQILRAIQTSVRTPASSPSRPGQRDTPRWQEALEPAFCTQANASSFSSPGAD